MRGILRTQALVSLIGASISSTLARTAVTVEPERGEPTKIYGAENIRRTLQRQKRDHTASSGSIAPDQHRNDRAIARRRRQEEAKRAKQQKS